jgi:hypothetical protein
MSEVIDSVPCKKKFFEMAGNEILILSSEYTVVFLVTTITVPATYFFMGIALLSRFDSAINDDMQKMFSFFPSIHVLATNCMLCNKIVDIKFSAYDAFQE